ncbi:MAG: hypothetical protein WC482_02595, partial [Candidatus Omnitrophota bacterium]
MIEYQINPTKRLILKAVAILLTVAFMWYDISWAADLFYNNITPIGHTVSAILDKDAERPREVTNYDKLSYDSKESIARKLLPTGQDAEQSNKFAPGYIQEQQNKHENIIRQKQDTQDMLMSLDDRLKRKLNKADESLDLKKKRGGGGGGGGRSKYTLENPDDILNPHEVTIPDNPQTWNQVSKYDITMMNIDQLMANTKKKEDDNGVSYWIGFGSADIPDAERLIMKVIYDGVGDNRTIKTIYIGYREISDGNYEAKYRIDYSCSGKDITETRKYDISGDGEYLVEKNTYEGTGDNNRIKKTVSYDQFGNVVSRRDFKYVDDALKEALLYDTDSETEGEGALIQRTVFVGAKSKEIADYTQNYYTDKETGEQYTTDTTVYYYKDGKRAGQTSGQEYRYSKSKQITYRGDPDTNGDGVLSDEELSSARKVSMLVYDDTHRLANEEVADYMVVYGKDGEVTSTTVYFYLNGSRASGANYRECMASAASYYGNLDKDGDGKISDEELAAGKKSSETFYDYRYRLKGEEIQDYTVNYLSDGATVTDTTVYIYEGGKRAKDSTSENRMQETMTYWGDAMDSDGKIKSDAKLKSRTFYQFTISTKRGEEVADITLNYYSDGTTVKDTTVYFYTGNKRAVDATNRTGLERTATFWGDALEGIKLLNTGGDYDLNAIIEFIEMRFGISADGSAEELKNALLGLIARQDPDLIAAILSFVIDMDPSSVKEIGDILNVILTLMGGNTAIILLLSSLDTSDAGSVTEMIELMLAQAGMDADSIALSNLILSLKDADFNSIGEFLDTLTVSAETNGLKSNLLALFGKIALERTGSLSDLISKLKNMTADGDLLTLLNGSYLSLEELLAATSGGLSDKLLVLLRSMIGEMSYYIKSLLNTIGDIADAKSMTGLSGLLETIKSEVLTDPNKYTDLNDFIDDLILRSAAESSTISDDLMNVFLEIGINSKGTSADLLNYLATGAPSADLVAIISDVTGATYADQNSLINDMISRAKSAGCFDELMGMLKTVITGQLQYINSLRSELLVLMAGDNAAARSLITAFLSVDIDSFSNPNDFLYTIIFVSGGDGLTELKNLLAGMGDISGYTAISLLTDLKAYPEASNEVKLLIDQLIGLVNTGEISDSELLGVLTDLKGGNPYALISALFAKIKSIDPDALAPLLNVITNGQVGLLNLLLRADLSTLTPESTARDLLNILMAVDYDGDAYPDLIEILMGTDPDDSGSFPASLVYKYEIKTGAKLKSQTFFHLDILGGQLPQSIADYTVDYDGSGVTIKNTTFYYYENPLGGLSDDVRAGNADRDQRRTRSISYKDDARSSVIDFDGDGYGDLQEIQDGTDPYDPENHPDPDIIPPSTDHGDDDGDGLGGALTPLSGNVAGDGIKDDAIRKSETFYAFFSGTDLYKLP